MAAGYYAEGDTGYRDGASAAGYGPAQGYDGGYGSGGSGYYGVDGYYGDG